jgi:hypothetical protein
MFRYIALFSFLLAFQVNAEDCKKVVDLKDFLSSEVFRQKPLESNFKFYAFTGSKSLIDDISMGLEKFGKISISYKFEEDEDSVISRRDGMILDTIETSEKITTVMTTGYSEFTFEMLKFDNAFSLELKSVKNLWKYPYRVSELTFNQISPFSSRDLPDESEELTGKAQRAACFAEDGRYMGVVSSAETLKEIDFKSANTEASLVPMKKGVFIKPGETYQCSGVWVCYFVGKDSRDGWRQRTNNLHIFPKGRKKDILSSRRKVIGQIDGNTVIRGSIDLDISKAKKVKDKNIKSRLCSEVASKILELDISDIDLSAWKEMNKEFSLISSPNHIRWESLVPLVFVNSKPLRLSCWPNEDWAVVADFGNAGIFNDSAMFDSKKNIPSDGTELPWFYYSGDRPSRWLKNDEILLSGFWAFDWHNSVVSAGKIDIKKKTITLGSRVSFGLRNGNSKTRRWRAYNLIEEIDVPGEYAIDRQSKKIYFIPPSDVSDIKRISIATGTNALYVCDGVKNKEFENIIFEESHSQGVVLKNCENVVFKNCIFRNMTREGVFIDRSCKNCVVDGCTFENFSHTAVQIAGGDKMYLMNGNNEILSSTIRNTSQGIAKSGCAIKVIGVGNAVRDCNIYNIPDIGIYFKGCNLALDGCLISNVCYVVDDSAAYYQGRNAFNRGNVLKNNLFIDTGTEFNHGNAAIYFDDGDCGNIVYSNLFVRCGFPGRANFGTVFSHGGYDNFVSNCRFVDCIRPFGSAPWTLEKWEEFFKNHTYSLNRDLENMKVPVGDYYPSILNFNVKNTIKGCNYAQDCIVDGSPLHRETKIKGEFFPGIVCGNWHTNRITAIRPCRWFDAFKKMPRSKK